MLELSKSIYGKLSGSTLETDIGGRLFKGQAPDGAEFPYVVYQIVSDVPDDVFAKKGESVLIQFSLYSKTSGSTEVEDMYTHLKALYDDCSLSITGSNLVWMRRESATLLIEEHTTPDGTQRVWAYHVDYTVMTQES